jgi:hypothetical protein
MLDSALFTEGGRELLQAGFEAAETSPWLVDPPDDTLATLVSTFRELPAAQEPVRLFAPRAQLTTLADDFLLASLTAELVAEGSLAVRTLSSAPWSSLLLTEESVVSLVDTRDGVVSVSTTAAEVVRATHEEYTDRWERAEPFSLRTPPLSEVRTTLDSQLGTAVAEDFDRALATVERWSGDRDSVLDGVTLALLAAANNGELLYDVTCWGEEIRLASKATFSRSKNRLEESGLVATEKVPIDVGRPRLRLVLADGLSGETGIEQVVRRARARLA